MIYAYTAASFAKRAREINGEFPLEFSKEYMFAMIRMDALKGHKDAVYYCTEAEEKYLLPFLHEAGFKTTKYAEKKNRLFISWEHITPLY